MNRSHPGVGDFDVAILQQLIHLKPAQRADDLKEINLRSIYIGLKDSVTHELNTYQVKQFGAMFIEKLEMLPKAKGDLPSMKSNFGRLGAKDANPPIDKMLLKASTGNVENTVTGYTWKSFLEDDALVEASVDEAEKFLIKSGQMKPEKKPSDDILIKLKNVTDTSQKMIDESLAGLEKMLDETIDPPTWQQRIRQKMANAFS
jgi:hypothetical protein